MSNVAAFGRYFGIVGKVTL